MYFKDLVRMNIDDIKKRKFRSFLTILSIGIGTMLLVVMFGIGNGVTNTISLQVAKLLDNSNVVTVYPFEKSQDSMKIQIGNEASDVTKPKEKKIDEATISNIKAIDGVKNVTAVINSKITSAKVNNIEVKRGDLIGINPSYEVLSEIDKDVLSKMKAKNRYNKDNTKAIIAGVETKLTSKDEVLVGQKFLDKMGIKNYESVIGKEIELKFEMPVMDEEIIIEPMIYKSKIVGVLNGDYPQGYGKSIILNYEVAAKFQEYISGQKDYIKNKGYSALRINVINVDKVKGVTTELKNMNYEFDSSVEIIDNLKSKTKIINVIFTAGGLVVLFVASFGLINTMSMAVQEKKKSIGIMKAVGASKRNITSIFLIQSSLLGFAGGILGSALGIVTNYIVNSITLSNQLSKGVEDPAKFMIIPLWFIAAAIGFSVVVSIIAGIVPSKKAARLDAVELLSFE